MAANVGNQYACASDIRVQTAWTLLGAAGMSQFILGQYFLFNSDISESTKILNVSIAAISGSFLTYQIMRHGIHPMNTLRSVCPGIDNLSNRISGIFTRVFP